MTTYEPGTVAVATVDGTPNVRIFIDAGEFSNITAASGAVYNKCDVTDVRPLVVLDLAKPHDTLAALSWHVKSGSVEQFALMEELRDQIEAQTKPPRIPEPGLWGIVEAGVAQHDERLRWSRKAGGEWECANPDEYDRLWGELIDPVLIRDGIEDGAS